MSAEDEGGRERLRARVEAHLASATGGAATVRKLEPLPSGACTELFAVEAELAAAGGPRKLVLRSDARTALPGSLGRRAEYRVVEAAVAAGVRTPAARWLAEGLVRDGAWAYFLDWIDGDSIGRRVVSHPKLAAARARLPEQLAEELAKIHAITPATAPGAAAAIAESAWGPPPRDPADHTLGFLRAMVDALRDPHPALELALRWLDEHRPPPTAVTLVHGDFRTGNFMVGEGGLVGLLDWEFARFSSPAEDLGWVAVRDWRFGQLDLPVGGFGRREPFLEAYARASGRAIEPAEVRWWEVLGNARWAAGSFHQGERYRGGDEDLELLAIARRGVEMEWEALRLMERGA